MFEVGFSELVMVVLVALIVIGPKRLPTAARIAGLWIGKLQSTIANVKIEIKQQLHAEEMRQIMQQQSIVEDVQQLVAETQQVVNDIKTSSESLSKDLNNHDKPA